MFRILGGPMSISIAFADALPLHYLILFSFSKIPCETYRIFGGPMSTSIAFAHDLSPICLTIFSFSNIPCGTCRILGGPISISIAFADALFQISLCYSLFAVSYRSVHVIRVSARRSSLCAGFAPIAFSTLVSYRAGRCLRT